MSYRWKISHYLAYTIYEMKLSLTIYYELNHQGKDINARPFCELNNLLFLRTHY
jgi:hypothetical protein